MLDHEPGALRRSSRATRSRPGGRLSRADEGGSGEGGGGGSSEGRGGGCMDALGSAWVHGTGTGTGTCEGAEEVLALARGQACPTQSQSLALSHSLTASTQLQATLPGAQPSPPSPQTAPRVEPARRESLHLPSQQLPSPPNPPPEPTAATLVAQPPPPNLPPSASPMLPSATGSLLIADGPGRPRTLAAPCRVSGVTEAAHMRPLPAFSLGLFLPRDSLCTLPKGSTNK
jgi:hypothetical protein